MEPMAVVSSEAGSVKILLLFYWGNKVFNCFRSGENSEKSGNSIYLIMQKL